MCNCAFCTPDVFRCVCSHQFLGRLFCVKAGGQHVDAAKSLEIANIAVKRLRAGDSLQSVRSQVVAWRVVSSRHVNVN